MNTQTLQNLTQAGIEAMRSGNRAAARGLFRQVIDSGQANAAIWLAYARCCDESGERLRALDAALALEPRNLHALIMKGDHLAAAGDLRGATAYYTAVDKVAAAGLAPQLVKEVERVREAARRYSGEFGAYLEERTAAGTQASSRFAQSIDLILGRKQLYPQQPLHYYFPELPQIQFYPREAVPFLDGVERAFDGIRAELAALMDEGDVFTPYVEPRANRPSVSDVHGMENNPDWGAYYLWKNGQIVPEHAERCPRTLAALANLPLTRIEGRAPSILFSLLRPRTRIPPHHGFINARLICHLPLLVPGECGLRVGNDSRAVVAGKAWAFDDSIEHEAWNDSERPRVILLFDVWRPELTEAERASVAAMFEAIDAYGPRQEWTV
jgi:aspartyl/asparaginyl beta-hydroxylase (cupin superfamily)